MMNVKCKRQKLKPINFANHSFFRRAKVRFSFILSCSYSLFVLISLIFWSSISILTRSKQNFKPQISNPKPVLLIFALQFLFYEVDERFDKIPPLARVRITGTGRICKLPNQFLALFYHIPYCSYFDRWPFFIRPHAPYTNRHGRRWYGCC